MTLIKLLGPHFGNNTQARGLEYASMGRVRIDERTQSHVHAVVRGSERYYVDFSFDGVVLGLSCSCRHFEDGHPCKHLWATALVIAADPELANWEGLHPREVDFEFLDLEDDPLDPFLANILPAASWRLRRARRKAAPEPRKETWRMPLEQLRSGLLLAAAHQSAPELDDAAALAGADILFVLDGATSNASGELTFDAVKRVRKKNGDWSKPKALRLSRRAVDGLPEGPVRDALTVLAGMRVGGEGFGYSDYAYVAPISTRFTMNAGLASVVLPGLCAAGRCVLGPVGDAGLKPLTWDDTGVPWTMAIALEEGDGEAFRFVGSFTRGEMRVPVATAQVVTRECLVADSQIGRLEAGAGWAWMAHLRRSGGLAVPPGEVDRFLELIFTMPGLPPLVLPKSLGVDVEDVPAVACLRLGTPRNGIGQLVPATLSFDYGGTMVVAGARGSVVYRAADRRGVRRDERFEEDAERTALRLGFVFGQEWRWGGVPEAGRLHIEPARVPSAVAELVDAGWRVEGEGKVFRSFTGSSVSVRSGIDWFELHGRVEFGEQGAAVPELLSALASGERYVTLGDGSVGLLPEEWLRRFAGMAGFGKAEGDHIRFRPTQAALLDALLSAQPNVDVDAGFEAARTRLKAFTAVRPAAAPETFVGTLRAYQQEGLGWLQFLRVFGFGGCLADDMGLGKTVMVLALLEWVRGQQEAARAGGAGEPGDVGAAGGDANAVHRPSIVVAPKSVVFNWVREAERFAPGLRVVDYTGVGRTTARSSLANVDLVVTSYGTLRQDAVRLKDVDFEYVILDEAQAIKNAGTVSAKAARLLRGRHRLALSGTPIENHVGELWSIFEFLNPGMLGSGALFKSGALLRGEGGEEQLKLLGGAVRPFILRRTKAQVATDLPARQEETLWCDLSPRERKLYDQLRDHYRAALLGRVQKGGLGRAKLQILEALLRLRQAACHPGLVDPTKTADGSAKLDVLVEQLGEVLEEGHKAIVFSQFTSLLALVRRRLDGLRMNYLYLDGQTRDREPLVQRFQDDERCKLFLISLKAGGLGLNLTAADYVYLLDPWWNPAAEAQAIDRAHRIGQTRPVFAYRLIARDTVEERILELQAQKRQLADAIITEDNSVIANLTREELEKLLR